MTTNLLLQIDRERHHAHFYVKASEQRIQHMNNYLTVRSVVMNDIVGMSTFVNCSLLNLPFMCRMNCDVE